MQLDLVNLSKLSARPLELDPTFGSAGLLLSTYDIVWWRMAAILNGFLPVRRKEQFTQERILNTRWGDAAISAPMHGGWNSERVVDTQSYESPELDRELPPTPPQLHEEQDGVFIVNDDECIMDSQDYDEDASETDRDNITITIPLPWKKKVKASSHTRKHSANSVLNARFGPPRRVDVISPPLLATAEAAAIPLPESRMASPVNRPTATSPVLSFRSRLASPNLGDILSPVAEGFAKSGPSTRMPVLSPMQYGQPTPLERPPTSSSTRSAPPRRSSLISHNFDGIGAVTMSSQATGEEQAPDMYRPSQGIGSTAHMRASSRAPRSNSQGPRATSVEPFTRRAQSVEPVYNLGNSTPIEPIPVLQNIIDFEPVRRRAPSIEPVRRRAPSVEPLRIGAPPVEPLRQRAPSVEPVRKRAPSVEPVRTRAPSAGPLRQRAPSVEPVSTRSPSVDPIGKKRAMSKEPRGRRGQSVEPRPRVRFHSEAGYRRPGSFSSNDGSVDSSDREDPSETEPLTIVDRFERDFNTSRKPHRRRSIASPISSPTAGVFGLTEKIAPPAPFSTFDSISARVDLSQSTSVTAQRNTPRNRSKSRTRGLYADMHDDFRLLARDVHMNSSTTTVMPPSTNSPPMSMAPTTFSPQPAENVSKPTSQRGASPAISSDYPNTFSSSIGMAAALRLEPERPGYSSDSSLTGLPSVSTYESQATGKAVLAALARDRKDQLRREERERAREKVARRLEHERERVIAMSSPHESENVVGVQMGGGGKTRRVYGGNITNYDEYYSFSNMVQAEKKTLVPNAEEIWG